MVWNFVWMIILKRVMRDWVLGRHFLNNRSFWQRTLYLSFSQYVSTDEFWRVVVWKRERERKTKHTRTLPITFGYNIATELERERERERERVCGFVGLILLCLLIWLRRCYIDIFACFSMRKEMPYHMISEKLFSLLTLIQIHQMKQ